jgi:DNA-3-methyladenine glycosylase I
MLLLEGAQAGLSWATILHKREGYREAFRGFDIELVAELGPRDVDRLLADPGIVRNRAKVEAAVGNAGAALDIRREFGSLNVYLWGFVGGKPARGAWRSFAEIPGQTAESAAMSRDLKRRGFRFVGPTTCYAFMQAVGMVNDHLVDCFRHRQIAQLS